MLTPLNIKPKPRNPNFRTLDMETWDGLKGTQFRMGAIFTGKRDYVFNTLDSMMKFACKVSKTYYVHNLSFDGRFILDWLVRNEDLFEELWVKPIYNAGIIALMVSYINTKGKMVKVRFIDSVGLLRASQKNLEKFFLGKVEKHEIDWSIIPSDEELTKRVRSDVIGMYKVLLKFFNEVYDLYNVWGVGMLTLGSLTMKIVRTNYLSKKIFNPFIIPLPNSKPMINFDLDKLLRIGYFGGRTEVFGNVMNDRFKGFNEIDANSFYPSQYHKPMPNGEYIYSEYQGDIPEHEGFFIGKLYEYKTHIPLLPTRYTGKTVFGYGNKVGVWGLPLIRYGLEIGVIKIDKGYFLTTKNSEPILAEFGKGVYANRLKHQEEENDVSVYIDKLLLNNAYGKFGQHFIMDTFYVKHYSKVDPIDPIYFDKTLVRTGNVYMISEEIQNTQNHQMVDKSSYITTYCLVEIHKELIKAKFPTYTDTDSIHGLFDITKHNVGSELGQWKEEYGRIIKATYLLPKLYHIEYIDKEGMRHTKCVAKGFSQSIFRMENSDEQRYITFEEFLEIIEGGYEIEIYMSLKQALRNNGKILDWHKRKRHSTTLISDKRIFKDDGTSEPIRVQPPKTAYEDLIELYNHACNEIDNSLIMEKGELIKNE